MKRWIAILLTVILLWSMAGFAEELEIEEEIIIESEDEELAVDEVELELDNFDLSMDGLELSGENEMDEVVELLEDVSRYNSSDDFWIEDGVLVKYYGTGGDVLLPNGIVSIGEFAFIECNNLTSVSFPTGLISIEEGAFYSCRKLQSVLFSDDLKTIGDEAFFHCSSVLTR